MKASGAVAIARILIFAVNPSMTLLAALLLRAIASRVHGRFAPILIVTEPFLFVQDCRW
jgi:hypothetical protein